MSATGYYRTPSIHDDTIVFACEDDLWSVPASGGIARRLTASPGECTLPRISPDGAHVAYVGREEGHPEIYLIPTIGGPSRRLTVLGADSLYCCGWSPEGGEVLFTADAGVPFAREQVAYAVSLDGGLPRPLGLGHVISYAIGADGRVVLGRNNLDPARWKRYRGGTAGQLWVDGGDGIFARLLPTIDGNLVWPMWLGEELALLSDHEGIANLYALRSDGTGLRRLTSEATYFARFPATDGRRIVYGAGGEIAVYDHAAGTTRRVPISAPSSAPWARSAIW